VKRQCSCRMVPIMPFRASQNSINASKKGKNPPPEETFEEASYLKSLGEKQKPVSVKLMDGEIVRGWVEYYDRDMIRLTREGAPNLFIFKHDIMYIAEGVLKETRPKTRKTKAVVIAAESEPSEG
jgi:host factor-I protein